MAGRHSSQQQRRDAHAKTNPFICITPGRELTTTCRRTRRAASTTRRIYRKTFVLSATESNVEHNQPLTPDTEGYSSDDCEHWFKSLTDYGSRPQEVKHQPMVARKVETACWSLEELTAQFMEVASSQHLSPQADTFLDELTLPLRPVLGSMSKSPPPTPSSAAVVHAVPVELVPAVRTRTCSDRLNWISDEDAVIRAGVAAHGNQWAKIAAQLPERTTAGVRNRWFRLQEEDKRAANKNAHASSFWGEHNRASCSDSISSTGSHDDRIKWRADEDRLIFDIIAQKGRDWKKIAQILPGRSEQAIRNRLYRLSSHASNGRSQGCWTGAEDQLIMASVQELGKKWILVAQRLPGRTEDSIRNRYTRLFRAAQRAASSA